MTETKGSLPMKTITWSPPKDETPAALADAWRQFIEDLFAERDKAWEAAVKTAFDQYHEKAAQAIVKQLAAGGWLRDRPVTVPKFVIDAAYPKVEP